MPPSTKTTSPTVTTKDDDGLRMVGTPAYYLDILKKSPHDQKAYGRLMVLYRQQKDYKKELHIINTAIKVFEKLYAPKKPRGKKISAISSQLNKALGLVDRKGKALYEQQPLAAWRKRRETVLKKIDP